MFIQYDARKKICTQLHFFFVFLKLIHNWRMTVNICWFNIMLLKLFSDKKRPDVEIYNALIMLRIALIHVHYIHLYIC